MIQRLQLGVALPKHPALEPPRQRNSSLVLGKLADGHGKDVVELLEGALLGLRHPKEDHDEGHGVEAGVEAKGADRAQRLEQ